MKLEKSGIRVPVTLRQMLNILSDIVKIVGGAGFLIGMIILRIWLSRDSTLPEWGNGKDFITLFGAEPKSKDSKLGRYPRLP